MSTITHVAGPSILIEGRLLQRCLICGAKLVDKTQVKVKTLKPGQHYDTQPGTWETGTQLQECDGVLAVLHGPDVNALPEDVCLFLVE